MQYRTLDRTGIKVSACPRGAMMFGAWQRRPRRPGLHSQASTRARVVIVGAGFGGLECARKLNRAAVDMLLLDRSGYHLFTPLLYQVADSGRGRRVRVDEFLRIPGAQRAYALGDAAAAGQDGQELPMVSAPAIQVGRYVARAIRADLRGTGAGPPFRYFDKGRIATIGRNAAVAQLRGGLELTGFAGWLAWLFVDVWYLAGIRNRIMALASWAWYYLRLNRPIRIILQTPPDLIVSTLRTPDSDKNHVAAAEIQDGGPTL
jgi:NADH dehydrogenase FAD-containing subunit